MNTCDEGSCLGVFPIRFFWVEHKRVCHARGYFRYVFLGLRTSVFLTASYVWYDILL